MKIALEELNNLFDYMNNKEQHDFLGEIEESDSYSEILDDLTLDFKHVVSYYLGIAISCNFDSEILSNDYKLPDEIVEILIPFGKTELEVKL